MYTMTDKMIAATTNAFVRQQFTVRDFAAGNFVVGSQNQKQDFNSQDDKPVPTDLTHLEVPAA